jgi:hypothetical protein
MTTATAKKFSIVYEATHQWLLVAYPGFDNGIDWDADPVGSRDWDSACETAGFDPNDDEVGFGIMNSPRPEDTLLRDGDIVATSGPGGDIAFLRLS